MKGLVIVKKEPIRLACAAALEAVKRARRKAWRNALRARLDRKRWWWQKKETFAEAAKYLNSYDAEFSATERWPWRYRAQAHKDTAAKLLAACDVTCEDEIALDVDLAAWVHYLLT